MAKLFFKYGTVFSAKSLNLIATAHNYQTQGKEVLLLIPKIDTRSDGYVSTRAGFKMPAELIDEGTDIYNLYVSHRKQKYNIDCILVDECQMLKSKHIDQLREIVDEYNTPVICYGLRVSYTLELFDASKRLFELADKLEEIKTVCWFCNNKATHNLKIVDGKPVYEGKPIDIGGLEKYVPVCYHCFKNPREIL
ncbi:thymidine kinase [Vallitalea sp.]|jgi:thymidine kinase|uniref:thymidine kinase n=1 Tax=Vallitalea sp. TaxID=1882829 RepID=UPI002600AD0B|nr:thymidine kinase [Vallitalea sp.]MCT4686197.1 thymidine kinase [Vallitalea sp.]